jgi:hypothetical protein
MVRAGLVGSIWFVLFCAVIGFAQVSVGPPQTIETTAATPPLDDLEQAWLRLVSLSEQLAYSECQRLESVQKYNATVADVAKRLEARHPAYTLDRARGVLVPIKAKP